MSSGREARKEGGPPPFCCGRKPSPVINGDYDDSGCGPQIELEREPTRPLHLPARVLPMMGKGGEDLLLFLLFLCASSLASSRRAPCWLLRLVGSHTLAGSGHFPVQAAGEKPPCCG